MKVLVGLVIVIVISLYSTWPMFLNMAQVTNFGHDGTLLVWIFNQQKLFDGNIFFPYANTLAYSDRHLLSGLFTRLPVIISHNPATAFGFAMISGQILTLSVLYLWFAKLSKNVWGATLSVSMLGLSPVRLEYQVHLQMWSMQYWLLGAYLLISHMHDKKPWQALLGGLFIGLQFWESPLPVYFALGLVIVIGLISKFKPTKYFVLALLLASAIASPLAIKYLTVSAQFNYHRDIRDAAHNSISLNDLWQKTDLGILLLAAILFAPKTKSARWLLIIGVLGLVLSLGPALKWEDKTVKLFNLPIPLPYAAAYYLVPGFDALRTPSRWLWLTAWSVSAVAAMGLRKARVSHLLVGLMIVAFLGSRVSQVAALPQESDIPKVYSWLKNQPGQTVLQLPVYLWHNSSGAEETRMFYSLYHQKTLVNGYSGFTPPSYIDLYKNQINQSSWPEVDYILVDKNTDLTPNDSNLSKIYEDEENIVYSGNN